MSLLAKKDKPEANVLGNVLLGMLPAAMESSKQAATQQGTKKARGGEDLAHNEKEIHRMETTAKDERFIRRVNQLALEAAERGFDPFAAILVKDNVEMARSGDRCIQTSDPTAHAERYLISEYCQQNQLISLEGYTLYCNVEPCVMCSGAIHWARISRVVFSVSQQMLKKVSKGKPKPQATDLINIGGNKIPVLGGVLAAEGYAVLKAYPFQSKKERHRLYTRNNQTKEDKV